MLGAPVFAFLPYETAPADRWGSFPAIIHVTDDPGEAAARPGAQRGGRAGLGGRAACLSGCARGPPRRRWQRGRRRRRWTLRAEGPIPPAFLMAALARALPEDAVLVEESPSNRNDLRAHVWIRRPASFFATASGGLGFAMPAAVGIKLASPERPVVCLVGDGSALYAPQALWSAVRLGAAVTFVIVNNGALRDPRGGRALRRHRGPAEHGAARAGLPGPGGVVRLPRGARLRRPPSCPAPWPRRCAPTAPVLIDVPIDPAPVPLLATEAS